MTGINAARGEVAFEADGRSFRLCLTLGALAEIESALGAESINDVAARLSNLSATDVLRVLAALIRGGGQDLDDADLAALPVSPVEAAAAVARCFRAAARG